jgi:hypothetical protein
MAWKFSTLARDANGWSMNTDRIGAYGNYYLKPLLFKATSYPGAGGPKSGRSVRPVVPLRAHGGWVGVLAPLRPTRGAFTPRGIRRRY